MELIGLGKSSNIPTKITESRVIFNNHPAFVFYTVLEIFAKICSKACYLKFLYRNQKFQPI
ncbi:MAG: hypothetical protein RIS29_1442 [Bacteroidota bacterium]|jgi:hypothetical protein